MKLILIYPGPVSMELLYLQAQSFSDARLSSAGIELRPVVISPCPSPPDHIRLRIFFLAHHFLPFITNPTLVIFWNKYIPFQFNKNVNFSLMVNLFLTNLRLRDIQKNVKLLFLFLNTRRMKMTKMNEKNE